MTWNIILRIVFVGMMLVFWRSGVNAQYFQDSDNIFQKLTVEDGLSQNTVNCILRDKVGFVWFGTRNGLNKFDGKNVTVFDQDFGNGQNLKDFEVYDIYEDNSGIIWITTDNGIIKYNYELEKFDQFNLSNSASGNAYVRCIEPENDTLLWLGTSNGLMLFNKKEGLVVEEFNHEPYQPHSLSSNRITTICNVGNIIWVGTGYGINILDKQKMLFTQVLNDQNDQESIRSNEINKVIKDSKNRIWIATDGGGLSLYNKTGNKLKSYTTSNSNIPHNDIRDIFEIEDGQFWLATNGGGLSLFDSKTGNFTNFVYNSKDLNGISNNSLYSVLVDYEGILWLGSYTGGVIYNPSKISDFKNIKHLPSNANSICEPNVRSMHLDSENNLWIGTLGGLSVYNPLKKQFKTYKSDSGKSGSLSFNKVTSIYEDKNEGIWLGTYSGGLNFKRKGEETFKHYNYKTKTSKQISSNNIFCILEDSLGNLWTGTSGGFDLYNKKRDIWTRKTPAYTRDACLGSNNKIYNAISRGIDEFDIVTRKRKQYLFTNEAIAALCVLNDSGEKIWFGTLGGGLGTFDVDNKTFKLYTTEDGLPSNFVAAILKHEERYLWLSTFRGISLFDKDTETFRNFDMADGIPFLEFHPRSATKLPDGTLAFGGTNGIVYFNPDRVINIQDTSQIHFSKLRIDGKKVEVGTNNSPLKKNMDLTEEINLRYSQNDFSIEFFDIDFKSKQKGKYAFILENYMKEWTYIGDQSMVSFTNMRPGKYVLKVKETTGSYNSFQDNEKTLKINIIPPFWMRWYFFLFIALAFIGLLYFYSKYTLISINQRNKIKLENLEYERRVEFDKLRLRFFTYISHELRTPLSLILDPLKRVMQFEINEEGRGYLNLIEKNTNRLNKLVNQIMDFRKLENDTLKLSVKRENIIEALTEIFKSFSETAKSKKVDYVFDNKVSGELFGWIDPDKLEKIIYNLLTNAFKFTNEGGKVSLSLLSNEVDRKIEIVVSDSGIGIKEENLKHIFDLFYSDDQQMSDYHGGVGIGLTYVKRLVELHHGTISVSSLPENGTSFSIYLPINKEVYNSVEQSKIDVLKPEPVDVSGEQTDDIEGFKELKLKGAAPLVLVVEDEPDLRKYLSQKLSKNFRVLTAINGKEAITIINKQTPDFILSDNVMPVMDGVELCNELKSRQETSHIPFVFLSAWSSNDFKLRGLRLGADDYITKPFDFDILEAKVTNFITNRRRFLKIAEKMVNVKPNDVEVETSDKKFIAKAQGIIENNLDNFDFTTKDFEEEIFMSHSVIYRKLKKITGLSANNYIKEYRLRRAAQILEQDKNITVSEVSFMVGFRDPKYFSLCFKKLFDTSPSEYSISSKRDC